MIMLFSMVWEWSRSILCFSGNKNIWPFVQHGQCHKYAYSISDLEWVQHLKAIVSDIITHAHVLPNLYVVVFFICEAKEDSWFIVTNNDRCFLRLRNHCESFVLNQWFRVQIKLPKSVFRNVSKLYWFAARGWWSLWTHEPVCILFTWSWISCINL